MIKKIFLLMLVGLIGGCTNLVKNPTDIKKSFVQIRKSVEVQVCGEKVFSRKMGISIIIVSQRFFSGGEAGREIRNNWFDLKSL